MRTWRDSTLRLRAEARETLEATLNAILTGEEAAAHGDGRARHWTIQVAAKLKVWAYLLARDFISTVQGLSKVHTAYRC